jgi:hypothetical protein
MWKRVRITATQKATKMEPSAWGYNWATLSLGDMNAVTWSSRLDARLTTLLYKTIIIEKYEEVKTGCNLAEFSRKGYGSKRTVLPVIMMME